MKEELIKLFDEYSELTKEKRRAPAPEGKTGEWFMKVQFSDFMYWLETGKLREIETL